MDELVKLVAQKTGLSEEMARTAVDTVIDFIKDKLPDPIAAQVDAVLGGEGTASGTANLVEGLGGLFGRG